MIFFFFTAVKITFSPLEINLRYLYVLHQGLFILFHVHLLSAPWTEPVHMFKSTNEELRKKTLSFCLKWHFRHVMITSLKKITKDLFSSSCGSLLWEFLSVPTTLINASFGFLDSNDLKASSCECHVEAICLATKYRATSVNPEGVNAEHAFMVMITTEDSVLCIFSGNCFGSLCRIFLHAESITV